ncbi:C-C motif chemokine 17-like [Myripristis murdjan]|uniref:C-C motif chemokine 17-like n=1 Tax=Myripristis murdjan TaxID=586833 RepID=A0A667YH11_9TELE|nr:C-C motif chemokine 17-like [Myripristis murdjan]
MKMLVILVLLGLACFSHIAPSDAVIHRDPKDDCCVKFSSNKIPLCRVTSITPTSSTCTPKAVVFTTVANKTICALANQHWVMSRIAAFQSGAPRKTCP